MTQNTQDIFPAGGRREEENETPARPTWAQEAEQCAEARRDDAVRSEGDLQLVDTGDADDGVPVAPERIVWACGKGLGVVK
jgi:hypothetical protein